MVAHRVVMEDNMPHILATTVSKKLTLSSVTGDVAVGAVVGNGACCEAAGCTVGG